MNTLTDTPTAINILRKVISRSRYAISCVERYKRAKCDIRKNALNRLISIADEKRCDAAKLFMELYPQHESALRHTLATLTIDRELLKD